MKNIPSFEVDHTKLLPGLYVSRKDSVCGEVVTTFDLRMCKPNVELPMNTGEIHAIEHFVATYLRNDPVWKDRVLYFGPMGCRTGFYMILVGDLEPWHVLQLVHGCFSFIAHHHGAIPGATARECGNYRDMNLPCAKWRAEHYANILEHLETEQMIYPKGEVENETK